MKTLLKPISGSAANALATNNRWKKIISRMMWILLLLSLTSCVVGQPDPLANKTNADLSTYLGELRRERGARLLACCAVRALLTNDKRRHSGRGSDRPVHAQCD